MGSRVQSTLITSLSCVFSVYSGAFAMGLRKQFISNIVFPLVSVLLVSIMIIIIVRFLIGKIGYNNNNVSAHLALWHTTAWVAQTASVRAFMWLEPTILLTV